MEVDGPSTLQEAEMLIAQQTLQNGGRPETLVVGTNSFVKLLGEIRARPPSGFRSIECMGVPIIFSEDK